MKCYFDYEDNLWNLRGSDPPYLVQFWTLKTKLMVSMPQKFFFKFSYPVFSFDFCCVPLSFISVTYQKWYKNTNWARQESVGQEISEVSFVCFMHHFTYWTLFISRINRAWLYKGHEDSGWQLNVDLAQLVRHWPEDLEVLVSNPTGDNFWRIFFLLFPV